RFQLNLDQTALTLADPECLADLEAVMAGGPPSAELYYTAAVILAASAAGRENDCARATGYLREAVQLGCNPRRVAGDPILKAHLSHRPDFQDVLNLPPARPAGRPVNVFLADPPGL